MIDEKPAHLLGRDSEEMCSVPPLDWLSGKEFQVEFVHHSRWLQGVARLLVLEMPGCQAPKFLIHGSEQFATRLLVAVPPGEQIAGY